MTGIQLFDLVRLHQSIRPDLDRAVAGVVDSGGFIGGPVVEQFEANFARYIGASRTIGCASGTDALSLALRAANIGSTNPATVTSQASTNPATATSPGQASAEVIVPAMTFVATAEAVVHAGAVPVIVDVDPDTLLISPDAVATAMSDRTRAVMPVHLHGQCVSASLIEQWTNAGLVVVEDTAQAHGATYPDRPDARAGTVGHAAGFSFYPGKNLGAFGDGGAVATNDDDLADAVIALRNHGSLDKFDHDRLGFCSRLDSLQAAVLDVKLAHLDSWNQSRRELAEFYTNALAALDVSPVTTGAGSVWHQFVIRVGPGRNQIRDRMAAAGVATGVHYPKAIDDHSYWSPFGRGTPVARQAADELLSLPMDPLLTESEANRVVEALAQATAQP